MTPAQLLEFHEAAGRAWAGLAPPGARFFTPAMEAHLIAAMRVMAAWGLPAAEGEQPGVLRALAAWTPTQLERHAFRKGLERPLEVRRGR